MDLSTLTGPPAPPTANTDRCPICEYWTCRCPTGRRLVAVGSIRRTSTVRVAITQAGITGSIRPAGAR